MTAHDQALVEADAIDASHRAAVAEGRWRLTYHVMPPVGWMNDPNGFVEYDGRYHLFFQYFPGAPEWGPMHWGHVVSDDLATWRYEPTALAPSEEYDANPDVPGYGCFSGSALADADGDLVLMYTGHVDGRVPMQTQNIAVSSDGVHFTKYEGNPVIATPPLNGTEDFRDPKLLAVGDVVYAVIGNQGDEGGRAALYRSDRKMREWAYVGILAASDGENGTMWECPDLFPLGDRHALVFSPMQGALNTHPLIQVGRFDTEDGTFTAESQRVIDGGVDFYAPQTMDDHDGRRIMIAWMQQWFQKNVTAEEGWAGAMTIPRELVLDADGVVRQVPLPELKALRGDPQVEGPLMVDEAGHATIAPTAAELRVVVSPQSTASRFTIGVRASQDGREVTVFEVDRTAGTVTCDRTLSGLGDTTGSTAAFRPRPDDGELEVRLFLDTCSVELFAADGEASLTNRIYPDAASTGFTITPLDGVLDLSEFVIWPMESKAGR